MTPSQMIGRDKIDDAYDGLHADFVRFRKECHADDRALRKLLWLSHGCTSLYGDDGEMQCNYGPHKPIDFKRDSVEDIETKLSEAKAITESDIRDYFKRAWSLVSKHGYRIGGKVETPNDEYISSYTCNEGGSIDVMAKGAVHEIRIEGILK